MASIPPPKVYRLQGIPSNVTSSDEVVKLLRKGREGLENYDVQVYSLATGLARHPSKVAGVMFSLRPQEEKAEETTPQASGDESNQKEITPGSKKSKKKRRKGDATSQLSRASTFRDAKAFPPGLAQTTAPVVSASGQADPFIEMVAQVKDGLVLDDNFFGMTPLVDIGLDNYEFDCIAISGIGSHAFGSWQPSGGDKQFMWIRDALPKFFPFARPILYGYDTQLCNAYSFQRVPDIALTLVNHLRVMVNSSPTKRPLVFITHSLGGIVLKEALVCLSGSLNTRDSELLEAISGAIFFGVPNHGMVIDHLIALASGWPNQYLIEDLKEGSWYLTNLDHSFSSLSRDKSFFWGYETKESIIPVRNYADGTWTRKDPRCPRLKLVERQSATRGVWKIPEKRHLAFQIDEDHSSMVKFASMHDPNLAIVINILSQIFERPVPEDVQDFSQPDTPANLNLLRRSTPDSPSEVDAAIQGNIDPVGNRDQTFKLLSESANLPALEPFFGRESELGALARLLEPPPQSKASWAGRSAKLLEPGSTSSQQIVLVYGPPGIGKTQFITQYIKSHRGNYDNIFCLDGTTIERLRLTLRREANRMRQSWSDLFFKALKLADTHSGNVERLCTFLNSDGNDKWLLVIDELRESSSSVTAIFERLKQGSIVLVSSSSQPATRYPAVRLGPLEQSPSVEMLLHYSPTSNLKVTSEHHNLLSTLEHHPTLIRLAVPKILGFKTISYFVQNWNNGEIKLPSQMVARIRSILEDEFPGGSTSSHHNLLNFCLLINHKAVSYEFLEFLNLRDLELFFSDTTERFARHGLLETRIPSSQTVTCSISTVLYQYLRQSIKDWPDNLMTGARILALKVPRSSKDNYRASIEILAPHAKIFAKYIINNPKTINPEASYLDDMERIASLLRLLGHDSDAIKLYGYIHQQNKEPKIKGIKLTQEPKLTDARTAELYNNMGLSCLNEGDITFACSCFDKAIATLKIARLDHSSTMLEVTANVARAKLEIEDYVAAEDLLVDMLSKFQGEDQGSLLPLQHFLGFARFKLGQTDQGIKTLEEACQTALKSPRSGKRLAYSIMHDLATAYREQKRFSDATTLYEKVREGRKSIHGPEHRYTIETTAALALSYHGAGQSDKAGPCFQKALKWQREHLRPNHPDTLQTLQNYGIFQADVGNLEAAKKALQLAYGGHTERDDKMGKVSWKRINAGVSLALVLQGLKIFKESATLFEEAVRWYRVRIPTYLLNGPHSNGPVQKYLLSTEVKYSKTIYQYCKTRYLQGAMYEEWGYFGEALKTYAEADKVWVSGVEGCEIDYWRQLAYNRMEELRPRVGPSFNPGPSDG